MGMGDLPKGNIPGDWILPYFILTFPSLVESVESGYKNHQEKSNESVCDEGPV